MGHIKGKNLIVKIDILKPNDYNPKLDFQENDELFYEFEKIKKSLQYHGQIDPILVRELDDGSYEIVNGYHRWMAMNELGFGEIEIKNLGKISRKEAIKKTLSMEELSIPLDLIEVAKLVGEIIKIEGNMDGLPYSDKELKEKLDLIHFDWEKFKEIEIFREGAEEINKAEKQKKYYFVINEKDFDRVTEYFSRRNAVYRLDESKLLEIIK